MASIPLRSAAAAAVLLVSACGRSPQAFKMPPPEVRFVRAHSQSVPLTRDIVGRLSPIRTADVRARVPGIVLKRLYVEGSDVRAAQPLFQIDPAPFKAALDAAVAALAQADANAKNAHITAMRDRALLPSGLIAQSDYDTAFASKRSTSAAVEQAEANVEAARINLGYATVRAPISGRSGQQAVTEGALVGQSTDTLLTTIEQIDPLYVNFDRPVDEILRLRTEEQAGEVTLAAGDKATFQIILPNGQPYPEVGTVDFSAAVVDPTNGALTFRGIIANPVRLLLPGMFVNLRVLLGYRKHAFLVSQTALRRDASGAYVMVVGPKDEVERRDVVANDMLGTDWIVTHGLREGERIIVSGVDKVRAGMTAQALPYVSPNAPEDAEPTLGGAHGSATSASETADRTKS